MKPKLAVFSFLAVLFLLLASGSVTAQSRDTGRTVAMGTAFTYQGRLSLNGTAASGAYDFQFTLYDSLSGGTQVGAMIAANDLVLADGYFTVSLDFGSGIFGGQRRYLEVRVRPGSQTGSFTTLAPRQELSAAPNALYALSAPWSGLSGVPAGFADGVDNDTTYTAGTGLTLSSGQFSLAGSYSLPQGCTSNQVPKWNGSAWVCAADESGTGGSSWSLSGNAGTNPATNYLGTSDNTAFVIRVNGLRSLRLEPLANGNLNLLGGYNLNAITSGVVGATLFGGGYYNSSSYPNLVTDDFGTVGGGSKNQAGNGTGTTQDVGFATIAGGYNNLASSGYATIAGGYNNIASNWHTTVGGGLANTASGDKATVVGGVYNTASGGTSFVGGGSANIASGRRSTVSGGYWNQAQAAYATVSGGGPLDETYPETTNNRVYDDYGSIGGGANNRAGSDDSNATTAQFATVGGGRINQAAGPSSTVGGGWVNTASGNASTVPGGANNEATGAYSFAAGADGHATDAGSFVWSSATRTDSWGVQTFTVRAPGGARFYSAAGTATGVQLAAGGGSFASLSDRSSKENFSPVNAQMLLDKVAALPIATWNYKTQAESIRHIGPVAQDFYSAFGVGEDEKYITGIDADGVALAAIQGLYQQNQQQAKEIRSLKARLARLEGTGSQGERSLAPTALWGVVALLVLSQAGMFAMVLRRKDGRR